MAPWELANAVTGMATLLSGVVPLLLCLAAPQPRRWIVVWWTVVLTGVFTVWYHGYGEGPVLRAFDTGSNLVVAYAILSAVLGDRGIPRRLPLLVAGVPNAATLALMFGSARWISVEGTLPLGRWGGYHAGELVLIADAVAVVALLATGRARTPPAARRALGVVTLLFGLGAALSTAGNAVVVGRIFALHAIWHLLSAFGFLALWVAVHLTHPSPRPGASASGTEGPPAP